MTVTNKQALTVVLRLSVSRLPRRPGRSGGIKEHSD